MVPAKRGLQRPRYPFPERPPAPYMFHPQEPCSGSANESVRTFLPSSLAASPCACRLGGSRGTSPPPACQVGGRDRNERTSWSCPMPPRYTRGTTPDRTRATLTRTTSAKFTNGAISACRGCDTRTRPAQAFPAEPLPAWRRPYAMLVLWSKRSSRRAMLPFRGPLPAAATSFSHDRALPYTRSWRGLPWTYAEQPAGLPSPRPINHSPRTRTLP